MRISKSKLIIYFALMTMFLALFAYGMYWFYLLGITGPGMTALSIYTLNFLITLFIFSQERQSKAKLSWLMTFAILPVIAHILFIIFGQRYNNVKSFEDYKKNTYFKYEQFNNKNIHLDKLSKFSGRGVYESDIDFYTNGEESFNKIFNDIKNAKKFIHLHYYIIKYGEIYDHFKNALIQKAKEGIEIRMIIDDFGRWALPSYEIKELQNHGIKIEIFGKVYFPFIGSNNGFRTHRKLVIIDGEVAHIGGLNIADEYVSMSKKYGKWIDVQARMVGQGVRSISLLFLEDWMQMSNEKLDHKKYLLENKSSKSKNATLMIEGTPETSFSMIEATFISMIENSKKSIIISTPYFVPSSGILESLRNAALSGIDVTIYIPGLSDKKIAIAASHYYAHKLQNSGVKIRRINNMFLHSKIGMFDDVAYFGTVNLDLRSIYSQFEIMNLLVGSKSNDIKLILDSYEKMSSHFSYNEVKPRWIYRGVLKFVIKLFSSMI